jgi:hypothetical protein
MWKHPHQTKGKVLRKTLQVLAVPGEVPISRRYLLEQGNCSRATGTYDDLVGQWSKLNHNINSSLNTVRSMLAHRGHESIHTAKLQAITPREER